MGCRTVLFSAFLIALAGCKTQRSDAGAASSGSTAAPSGTSEMCGSIDLRGQIFYFTPEGGKAARVIDPQDGASTNILKDSAEKKSNLCITARWSGRDPVLIPSAAVLRDKAAVAAAKEECGTVLMKQNDIVFQVSGNNSENNIDHVLEPQDGAVANILQDMAMRMAQACIRADFSKTGRAVLVKSAADISENK